MPKPYPREFRDDVVRVARGREDGVTIKQIATDFGVRRAFPNSNNRSAPTCEDDRGQLGPRPCLVHCRRAGRGRADRETALRAGVPGTPVIDGGRERVVCVVPSGGG